MAFTFSCSGGEDDDNPAPSSSGGGVSSSSVPLSSSAGGSSSSVAQSSGGGGSSSSVLSSSSGEAIVLTPCPDAVTGEGTLTCGGRTYKTVKIGEQTWMAENMSYDLPGSRCDSDPDKCEKYGRTYDNWDAAMAVCPSGWNLPSHDEWNALVAYIQADKNCTDCAAAHLKAKLGWSNCGPSGSGNTYLCEDSYGFAAPPLGIIGGYWSSTEYDDYYLYYQYGDLIPNDYPDYVYIRNIGTPTASWGIWDKGSSIMHVRCIKTSNSGGPPSSSSGGNVVYGSTVPYEGKTYKTVVIGEQTWMAENLNYAATGSKCASGPDLSDANTAACDKYGRLYNWVTAMVLDNACNSASCAYLMGTPPHKGICPDGWHIPANAEWDALYRHADGTSGTNSPYSSATAGRYLKTEKGWNGCGSANLEGRYNCEDTHGFAALPGGSFFPVLGSEDAGNYGYWWSTSETKADEAYARRIFYDSDGANYYSNWEKLYNLSIRCVKD